jgi:hypothetical protein
MRIWVAHLLRMGENTIATATETGENRSSVPTGVTEYPVGLGLVTPRYGLMLGIDGVGLHILSNAKLNKIYA